MWPSMGADVQRMLGGARCVAADLRPAGRGTGPATDQAVQVSVNVNASMLPDRAASTTACA